LSRVYENRWDHNIAFFSSQSSCIKYSSLGSEAIFFTHLMKRVLHVKHPSEKLLLTLRSASTRLTVGTNPTFKFFLNHSVLKFRYSLIEWITFVALLVIYKVKRSSSFETDAVADVDSSNVARLVTSKKKWPTAWIAPNLRRWNVQFVLKKDFQTLITALRNVSRPLGLCTNSRMLLLLRKQVSICFIFFCLI
jgi:hypothetical protein